MYRKALRSVFFFHPVAPSGLLSAYGRSKTTVFSILQDPVCWAAWLLSMPCTPHSRLLTDTNGCPYLCLDPAQACLCFLLFSLTSLIPVMVPVCCSSSKHSLTPYVNYKLAMFKKIMLLSPGWCLSPFPAGDLPALAYKNSFVLTLLKSWSCSQGNEGVTFEGCCFIYFFLSVILLALTHMSDVLVRTPNCPQQPNGAETRRGSEVSKWKFENKIA